MSPLIARLANLSFKDGVFPSRYKAARVTPLLKKPNLSPHKPTNYRPISNLGKLFPSRSQPHVMKSANYCKFQSTYRKGHSTETALLRVVNNIQRAAGNGQYTCSVCCDRHIISVRCRRPLHADRSYCVRHQRRRLGLASILRYRADPADRRWIGEVSRVPARVWRTVQFTDAVKLLGVTLDSTLCLLASTSSTSLASVTITFAVCVTYVPF